MVPAGRICSESRLALDLLRNLMSQSLNGSRPRVLIADDHAMFAETLREFLAAKYDVVGPVADGAALFLAAAELTPDLAVVDIGLTLPNGLNASCQLRQNFRRSSWCA
jgi:DNA-binding NarL/FixJ family response regulator